MTRKFKYACKTCGSEDVTFDATAEWDVETQTYVVSTLFDDCFCGSEVCQGETRRVQEYDADTGEALALGPGSFDYIPKAEADAEWKAYHERLTTQRKERDRAEQQELLAIQNASALAAAMGGMTS